MIFPENCPGIFRVAHVGMKVLGYSYTTLSQHGRLPDKVSSFQDIPTFLFHYMLTCGNIKCIRVANIYQAREVPPEKAVPTIAAMISEAEHQRRAVPPRGAFWHVGRVGHLPSSETLDPNDFVVLKYRIYTINDMDSRFFADAFYREYWHLKQSRLLRRVILNLWRICVEVSVASGRSQRFERKRLFWTFIVLYLWNKP